MALQGLAPQWNSQVSNLECGVLCDFWYCMFVSVTIFTLCACARGKVIGLYVCRRPHENH